MNILYCLHEYLQDGMVEITRIYAWSVRRLVSRQTDMHRWKTRRTVTETDGQTDRQTTGAACQGSPWPLLPCLVWSSSAVGQSVWRAQLTSLPPQRPLLMLTLKLSCSMTNDLQGERVQAEEQLQMEICEKLQKQKWIRLLLCFKSPELFVKEVNLCCCTLN